MEHRQTTHLDVRAIPASQRHPKILAVFDALDEGAELRITSDHEPRPLRSELERTRTGQYVLLQRMLSHDQWEVTLRRVVAPRIERVGDFLRRCPLFAGASAASVTRIEAVAIEKLLAHNEALVEQDADWDDLGLVWSGTVAAIITSPLGREHVLYDVLSTEVFGEIAAIGSGSTIGRFVVTSRSARILLIPTAVFHLALNSDLALSRAMNDHLAQRMRVIIERFAAQTSLPTVARVAAALLAHAVPNLGLQPVLAPLANLTQTELAASAGTVKEVVNRALAELESGGAIERSGGHIVKTDREKLAAYAKRL